MRRLTRTATVAMTLALLAACGASQRSAQPISVRLDAERLYVRMDDGSRCSVPRNGEAGRFERCGGGMDWTVQEHEPNVLRRALESGLTLVGAQGILSPMATITITAADGTRNVFELPDLSDLDW
ncbi:MAG: hypothetical protein WAK98_00335 [Gemmobacter sp.]